MAWGNGVKSAWNDKFRRPLEDELRIGLPKPLRQVFEDARERLIGLGASEAVVWQGVPWRWTFVYETDGSGNGRALAYIIPDPNRLQVCIPLASEAVERLPLKRMKKSIRDGVVFARHVAGVSWPTWDVPTKGALDEVFELISRKHAMLAATEAAAAAG